MGYEVEILADSISPDGVRLTTMRTVYPRFIHAEMLRHRVFSHSVASSRAIPPEKMIERVLHDPFVPETFNSRVKEMGVGEALEGDALEGSRLAWLSACDAACLAARRMVQANVDKSRVNRVLEPYLWLTDIISSTEWSNFFALRDHPGAQPEFQIIAHEMRAALEEAEPRQLDYGWWHLPFVSEQEFGELCDIRNGDDELVAHDATEYYKAISVGRTARVSFDRHDVFEDPMDSIAREQRLKSAGHFSPFEHIARPAEPWSSRQEEETFYGNFRQWVQARAEIPNEDDFSKVMVQKEP